MTIVIRFFLVYAPMSSSITLDNSEKVTNLILTGISYEKNKQNLVLAMLSLATGRIILKFNNSVLVQKSSSSLYSSFVLNLCTGYELNNQPRNPTNSFPLKSCLSGIAKLVRNTSKRKITYNDQGIAFDQEDTWNFGNDFARNCNFWC